MLVFQEISLASKKLNISLFVVYTYIYTEVLSDGETKSMYTQISHTYVCSYIILCYVMLSMLNKIRIKWRRVNGYCKLMIKMLFLTLWIPSLARFSLKQCTFIHGVRVIGIAFNKWNQFENIHRYFLRLTSRGELCCVWNGWLIAIPSDFLVFCAVFLIIL